MAQRLGPSLEWWLEQSFAFALWSFHQLCDGDRARHWSERMQRLEGAEMMAIASHKPEVLAQERTRIIAMAATRNLPTFDPVEHGERMARFIRKGHVLDDEVPA